MNDPSTPSKVRRTWLLAAALVLLLTSCGSSSGGSGDDLLATPVVDLEVAQSSGEATDLATIAQGRPLVVNLWASWCVPCLEEMPAFDQVHRSRGDEVAIIGVTDDEVGAATKMAERTGATYPLVIDADRSLARQLQASGMPLTVFVSPEGELLGRHQGALDAAGLEAEIDRYWGTT